MQNTQPKMNDFLTPTMFSSVRSVLLATVHHQHLKEKLAPVQAQCIKDVPLYADLSDGAAITSMDDAYLSEDEGQCGKLYDHYKTLLKSAGGFGLSDAEIDSGKCPVLVADHLRITAENLLLQQVGQLMGFASNTLTLAKRKQLLDLTLRMVVNAPGFRCELPAQNAVGGGAQ